MTKKAILVAGTALGLTIGAGQGAFAQTASTGGTSAATPSDSGQVGEIIVTATRRETSLQKTPVAVSAFTQATLDRQQVKDVTDLARFVPSLQFNQQGDQSAILLTLRGIGNDSAYTEVADPEVAIYVDGVYSPRAQGAVVLLYDLERAEVLRGPQGTLFGRNATVGALNLTTAKPKIGEFSGYLEGVAGSYSRYGLRGAINIPVTDTLAIRIAAISDRHDGYADYQQPPAVAGIAPSAFVTKGKKYYAADQQSGRINILWKPSDKFTWNVGVEGYKDTGAPVTGLMQNPRPGQKMWSILADTAPDENRWSVTVHSTMDYNLSDGIQASYIAGYQKIGGTTQTDSDAGTLPPTSASTPSGAFQENRTVSSSYQFQSHELQLKSRGTNTIDWIIGGYYSHEKNQIRFDVDQRNGYRDGTFSWAGSFIQADREIDSLAAFGQATWHVNDKIRLTGGLRYTDDKKQDIGGRNVTYSGAGCSTADKAPGGACTTGIFGAYPDATAQQLVTLLPGYGIANNDVKGKWHKLTYLGRADADLAPGILGYASISTGFKSGNIQDNAGLTDPESLTNYEIGLKTRLFDNRMTLNVAAYYADFKGYQVNQAVTDRDSAGNVISSQLVTQNAKGAKAYGFEAEMSWAITETDRLQFAGTVQKTKLDELESIDARLYNNSDQGKVAELKGNELAHAPRFSMTATLEHDFLLPSGGKITPRATTHYETKSWLSYFNGDANPFVNANTTGTPRGIYGTAFDQQKAYFKTDFSLRYEPDNKAFMLEGFVENIENKKIRTGAGSFGAPATPVFISVLQAPRTWGVRARAKF